MKFQICGFDFEENYGDVGRGFIEVHHKKPISTVCFGKGDCDCMTNLYVSIAHNMGLDVVTVIIEGHMFHAVCFEGGHGRSYEHDKKCITIWKSRTSSLSRAGTGSIRERPMPSLSLPRRAPPSEIHCARSNDLGNLIVSVLQEMTDQKSSTYLFMVCSIIALTSLEPITSSTAVSFFSNVLYTEKK